MLSYLLSLALVESALAVNLYASSYAGQVTSLSLTGSGSNSSLVATSQSKACGGFPAWLTLDEEARVLYCLDEGWGTIGSVNTLSVADDGKLTGLKSIPAITGPVSGVFFNTSAGRGYAIAQYSGSAVSIIDATTSNITSQQVFTYNLTKPTTNPDRQEAPHPHQAIADPSGKYILVPDLGADVVRIYSTQNGTLNVKPSTDLVVKTGSGPRHATFWRSRGRANNPLYFFLVSELDNRVSSYRVTYGNESLVFAPVTSYSTFGNFTDPKTGGAAEIAVSPDNNYLYISNRQDASLALPGYAANTTVAAQRSDSISVWAINRDGTLTFRQLAAAGGSKPRHFSFNKAGDKIAVALQGSSRVAILGRNRRGTIDGIQAWANVTGEVNAAIWDE